MALTKERCNFQHYLEEGVTASITVHVIVVFQVSTMFY